MAVGQEGRIVRLQDLREDLGYWARTYGEDLRDGDAALLVARRVADLYDTCGDCDGVGFLTGCSSKPVDMVQRCPRCGGTGAVPLEVFDERLGRPVLILLARHLFGEET